MAALFTALLIAVAPAQAETTPGDRIIVLDGNTVALLCTAAKRADGTVGRANRKVAEATIEQPGPHEHDPLESPSSQRGVPSFSGAG
jgi:hypothetical protein